MSDIRGVFSANARGFGFVSPQEGGPDIFIPEREINGALHSDVVDCHLRSKNKNKPDTRQEGAIVRIISRGIPLLTGTFYAEKKAGYLYALDNRVPWAFDITAAAVKKLGLVEGHRVMFSVGTDGRVQVAEIFGHKNDPGMDVLSIVRQYAVPVEFSEEALLEAAALPQVVKAEEMHGRADFRDWPIVTIDGSDTKDIDDAVSLRRIGNLYELGVHIADVSHYVKAGSELDKEARTRGTSIYLADRVIPMLPHLLSNGICSLNPEVDRLALSCIMEIDEQGDVIRHRVEQSVIRSRRRYSYDEGIIDEYLAEMDKLAQILRDKRQKRGALDFNFAEAQISVDNEGFPTAIDIREANAATSLIEEFMILCNETIAEQCKDSPFIFRCHEGPEPDKLYQLSAYAQNLGYKLPVSERGVSVKALQKLLQETSSTPEGAALAPMILRSMKQARYTAENSGHFGLASRCYCHFTSPIRRYPDLLVHRSIKKMLKKRGLPDLCIHCSQTERRAEELERDVTQLKKAQFMADKLGQRFEATVSGVVNWGFFVQLPNTIEGLVPINFLIDDEYVFVEKQMALFGSSKKRRIRIGDQLTVELSRVDLEERKIIFAPIFAPV